MTRNRRLPQKSDTGSPPRSAREEGAILVLLIWILALLSVVVLSWAQEWRTELRLAANFRDDRQCHHLAEAGIYYALAKLKEARITELQRHPLESMDTITAPQPWIGDQRPHLLELPGGKVEVRVADEAGKINLNQAEPQMLKRLLEILGFPAARLPVMVDSILDWRSPDPQTRPFGAKSAYYLSLDPPYPAKDGRFDTVEELAWVRGFSSNAEPLRLSAFFTVQNVNRQINLNTAPQEVLLAMGLPPDLATTLIQEREVAPLQSQDVISRLAGDPNLQEMLPFITFKSSTFFSILATGMINNREGALHTIKVVVKMMDQGDEPWKFLYWADDYPG